MFIVCSAQSKGDHISVKLKITRLQKNAVFFFFFKLTRILYLGLVHWLSPHLKTIWQVWFCFPPSFVKYYSVICQDYLYLKLYHHYNSLLYSCVIITFVALLTSNRFSVTKLLLFFFLNVSLFFVFVNFSPLPHQSGHRHRWRHCCCLLCVLPQKQQKKAVKLCFIELCWLTLEIALSL